MKELVHQARFTYPRFADDGHDLTATGTGKPLRTEQSFQFDISADEARQTTPGIGLKTCSRGTDACNLIDLYRISETLHRLTAKWPHGNVALHQLTRIERSKHGTWFGHLFHATCQMGRSADNGEIHVQVVPDRADDNFPRVNSDADRQLHPMGPTNLVRISDHSLLHPEASVTGAHGMILKSERRAKKGHYPVAHNPVNSALIAMNCLNHAFEHGVEKELLRGFGVAANKQLHRTLDISEQDSDLLPLTLEGSP
jgi:hypothetical protein